MDERAAWYVKTDDGKVYGPAEKEKLVSWAEEGRIDPVSFVSQDRITWLSASQLPELKMQWLIETEPGKVFGPFCRSVAIRLFREKKVPPSSKTYCLHKYAIDQDPPPVERIVEKEVIREVYVEMPGRPRPSAAAPGALVPSGGRPLAKVRRGSLFGGFDRAKLAALEAAARRELAAVQRHRGMGLFGFLGGKKK